MKKKFSERQIFLGAMLVIVILGIIASFNQPNLSGAVTTIEYNGVGNALVSTQVNKMQTLIELRQPVLKNLANEEERKNLAEDILSIVDFNKGIVELYQSSSPAPIPYKGEKEVAKAASVAINDFKNDLSCLRTISSNYGRNTQMLDVHLVSELKYQGCNQDSNQWFVYMKHSFFEGEGNSYVCEQNSKKLFLIKKDTGIINIDTSLC